MSRANFSGFFSELVTSLACDGDEGVMPSYGRVSFDAYSGSIPSTIAKIKPFLWLFQAVCQEAIMVLTIHAHDVFH